MSNVRYKRILLCMADAGKEFNAPPAPPLSLGYLSEYLSKNNIEHEVVDMRLGWTLEDLKNKIKEFKPDLIGISSFAFRQKVSYSLILSIKNKEYDIIIGGAIVTTKSHEILEETDADYALRGEGEEAFLNLCNGKPLNEIGGLMYKKNGKVIENMRNPFSDVTKIPFPKYRKFELKRYTRKRIGLLTSRGCPYSCIFCSNHNIMGKKIRYRTAEDVVDEIKYWYDKGYRSFGIIDDNFSHDKQRVLHICNKIKLRKLKGVNLSCGNGLRADKIDREFLTAMKEVGLTQFRIGVEVGNNKMLKAIKKSGTIEENEKAIRLSCEMGFDVSLNFILGFPKETEADIRDSLKLALKYPVKNVCFYNAIPFPGTELYDYIKKNNLFVVKDPDYLNEISCDNIKPIFETPELPVKKRIKLMKIAIKIEKKVMRKAFVRKFKKYNVVGNILSHIIFFKLFYKTAQQMSNNSIIFKKMLIYITERYGLQDMEILRKK